MEEPDKRNDCPVGILVDLDNSNVPLGPCSDSCSTLYTGKRNKIAEPKSQIIENLDLKEENFGSVAVKSCSIDDDFECKSKKVENELSNTESCWKTPSPQSMSLISSEASKVIHNLNSTVIFDEDDLFNEEILSVPLNFDEFDLDISDQENEIQKPTNISETGISDHKLSISIQTEDFFMNSNMTNEKEPADITIDSAVIKCAKSHSESKCLPEQLTSKGGKPLSLLSTDKTCDELSKNFSSCETQNDSSDSSRFSTSNDATDDVFIMSDSAFEFKENKTSSMNENLKNDNIARQKSFVLKNKIGSRETLKNLSNIPPNITGVNCVPNLHKNSNNKQFTTPQAKRNIKSKGKILQFPSNGKQLGKTVSAMESKNTSKRLSFSNSFHFQSTRELISHLDKPCVTNKDASLLSSSSHKSSGVKQLSQDNKMKSSIATPSRKYSVSVSLKGTVPNLESTPSLPNSQDIVFPRFTPRSTRTPSLSFSKSLQHSSDNPHALKDLKRECPRSSSNSSKILQPSLRRLNPPKVDMLSSQTTSDSAFKVPEEAVASTLSKKRFYSRLSLCSPLLPSQDKSLARALFPNIPKM